MRIFLQFGIAGLLSFPLLLMAQTVEHPLPLGGKVKPPLVLRKPNAATQTEVGNSSTIHTTSLVSVVIDDTGKVRHAQVFRPSGNINEDQKALEIARGYEFKPATLKGQPVAVSIILSIEFSTPKP